MANRMKEDEKNEKIIRGLLKLPGNRRCINCNSLGPQYVCTNFWTFVCTTCSGIHREFTHRVKSVSMAKFTSQEVTSLQNGGNERAKEIYLKDWDQQRNSFPDSSNVERLRDFIKHVYEDRRYTAERGSERPPRVKMVDREDSYKQRSGSRSPPSEDSYERNYGERSGLGGRNEDKNFRYNYEGRSPGYDQDNQKYGDYKRSPARFETGDDRYQDDRSGSRRSEDKFQGGDSKLEGRSPIPQKDLDSSSPPVIRPVRDILGENVPPLRIGEPPKANGGRASGGSIQTQRTVSSSSMGSVDGNLAESERASLGSLIDFTADPEPPHVAAAAQAQPPPASTVQTFTSSTNASSGGNNWASFDSPAQEKGSQFSSSTNTVDSVVSLLSVPAALPAGNTSMSPASGGLLNASIESMSQLSIGGAAVVAPVSMPILHPGGNTAVPSGSIMSMPVSGPNSFVSSNDVGQWPRVQQPQQSPFTSNDSRTTQPPSFSVGGGSNNQSWSSSSVSNFQGPLSTPTLQSSQSATKLTQEVSKAPLVANLGGRKALPEDLFTSTYASVPGWQAVPHPGMGFGMQYPAAMLQRTPTFPQASRSTNPFDVHSEAALVHPPMFPSMGPLQGAPPNSSAPTGLLRTSSLGTPMLPQWMPSQTQAYASAMAPQPPAYVSGMPSSAYMGQQMPSHLPPGHQVVGGFGGDGSVFGSSNTNPQLRGRFSAPATPNSFSSIGGNPFG